MSTDEFGGGQTGRDDILDVTTNEVPGREVQRVIGEIFGLTVRSRNLGSQIGAGIKSVFGGELRGLTKTLAETRQQAVERLIDQARERGADAVLAMRYEVSQAEDIGTEVCAYGTAVVLGPPRG
ncbi:YbjQ family protein [Streptomyces cacaoi]|uniref:YbjQ family protein n=1 Tax=Streptomyces cacaoi TaxID=1898 RepID=UPI002606FFFD|nr:YbjQ family protein [Streptomyces cacaoi]